MSNDRMTATEVRDRRDFMFHPEWFEVCPLQPDPEVLRQVIAAAREAGMDRELIDRIIRPPMMIRRKPIPFVLPIKGSAL